MESRANDGRQQGIAPASQPRLRLTDARNYRGWSQQEVAERIGTTHVNVSRWERGITRPSPYFRRKLATLFGKTEEDLDLAQSVATPPATAPQPATSNTTRTGRPSTEPLALYDPAIPLRPAIALVGRDEEMEAVKKRLKAGGSVALTALNGLPGVGKTALAIALAHDEDVRAYFRDGVLWAALGPLPNIPGLLSRWGTLLGIPAHEIASLTGREEWAKALRSAIGTRAMLLVIDDAWQLEEALTFKVGGPNCAHLITTRYRDIASYVAIEGATELHELPEKDSLALLSMLAPGVVEREQQMASDLVHAVGGLPLALTLLGNYLRKQAYSGQARRIHTALARLSHAEERLRISEPHGPVESHPSLAFEAPLSLQSVISVTDQQLSLPARAALYALSVFPPKPNTFSEDAALAVAASSVETLDTLVDTGLLETTGSDRYTIHQVISDYAHLHLKSTNPHERLITYIVNFVEAHKKDYELLEQDSATILAALETAYEQQKYAELARMVIAYSPFMLSRALYKQATMHLERAREGAKEKGDTSGLTGVLLFLGEFAQKQGNYAQAEALFQEGLTLAREIGDQERICALLHGLGWVTLKRGEFAQAEEHLQEGLSLARQIEDQERICSFLRILGSIAASRGEYLQAETYLLEGLPLARQIGDHERTCLLLISLGATVGEQGHLQQAEIYFQEALVLARQIGHREWVCALLSNLGGAAAELENYFQANDYFQEGLTLARQIGHTEWISLLLSNLGVLAKKQRNYNQALKYFQESVTLARQIGIPQMIGTILYEYGHFYLEQEQIEVAKTVFSEMRKIIPEGSQDLLALANYGQARIAAAQGGMVEAYQLGEASAITLETTGHRTAREVREWLSSLSQ